MAVRSEGQFIGEMALFAVAAVRCASVRAKGPVRVKIVAGESLEELIDIAPEVWLKQTVFHSFFLSFQIYLSFLLILSF